MIKVTRRIQIPLGQLRHQMRGLPDLPTPLSAVHDNNSPPHFDGDGKNSTRGGI